ncbi:MAG: DUF6163 family protein [Pseudomonadota bacterium]
MIDTETGAVAPQRFWSEVMLGLPVTLLGIQITWRLLLLTFLRVIGGTLVIAGIIHWARIIGYVPWRGYYFWDMPTEWQAVTVYFAVFDLAAAVGLWLCASWGVVMWLLVALSQMTMHSMFSETFGERPWEITYYMITIVLYFSFAAMAEREARS